MRFPAKITSSCIWVAIPVDWIILRWYACGADGRSQIPRGLDNSQSRSANVFRVDDPRSEPRVLHELRQKKMAEDAASYIAIRFVNESD